MSLDRRDLIRGFLRSRGDKCHVGLGEFVPKSTESVIDHLKIVPCSANRFLCNGHCFLIIRTPALFNDLLPNLLAIARPVLIKKCHRMFSPVLQNSAGFSPERTLSPFRRPYVSLAAPGARRVPHFNRVLDDNSTVVRRPEAFGNNVRVLFILANDFCSDRMT